jgi:hypothetical protein
MYWAFHKKGGAELRHYDGHGDGHCTDCGSSVSQDICDAMGRGAFDRALGITRR